jgi:AraC-like DNA-binding protein
VGAARHTSVEIGPFAGGVVSTASVLQAETSASQCPAFPDPSVFLTFGGGTWTTADGASVRGGGLRVLGVLTRRWSFDLAPGEFLVTLGLRPGAAHAALGVPASEVTDDLVRLEDLWGARARRLERALSDLAPEDAVLRLIDEFNPTNDRDRRAGWIEALETSGGRVQVDELARQTGVTRQQLRRQSRRDVGVSPKLAGRLMRFQGALAAASSGRRRDWSEVAMRLGYFDQAHLIAEFREFAGTSPTQLA